MCSGLTSLRENVIALKLRKYIIVTKRNAKHKNHNSCLIFSKLQAVITFSVVCVLMSFKLKL